MKKVLIIIAYWLAAIFLTTMLLVSLDYTMAQAFLMSLTFLPTSMALSFLLPKVDRAKDRRGRILDSVFIILGVMTTVLFPLFSPSSGTCSSSWIRMGITKRPCPHALESGFRRRHPCGLAYGNYVLGKMAECALSIDKAHYLLFRLPEGFHRQEGYPLCGVPRFRSVVFARDGETYRNRNGIGQWENLRGGGFLRIHRAFLVNVTHATLASPDTVLVAGKELPVSRKKKRRSKLSLIMNRVLILLSLLFVSLSMSAQDVTVDGGRFRKGDDPAWSAFAYDDGAWQEVTFSQSWEDLGLEQVNGIGWYRLHVVIPSSLKKGVVEAIMLDLGAIDDSDQTWINGHPVGKTGTFPEDPGGYSSEYGKRRYYIVDPSWVRWDKDNVIAVRVYNYGEPGRYAPRLRQDRQTQPEGFCETVAGG
jgi:LytTr DNA-binding domain./Glycosyl hydrolases family 2, sugar binding domain.